ncbi:MAG: hydroxymethylglutaryl-CoA reductase [Bacteroidales bacterium]
MALPKDRKNNYSRKVVEERAQYLARYSNSELKYLHNSEIDPNLAKGNIENIIGFAQVPVGVAGPLKINGQHAKGEFYVPMSTTEGALLSSYNRGARAATLSGGINVIVTNDSMQRAPYFILENVFKAGEFVNWFGDNLDSVKKIVKTTSSHADLQNYKTYIQGRIVYMRLAFSTGDAMGMNMITKACNEICEYIKNNFPVLDYALESNMAVDKKPSHINTILGRGKTVTAEILLQEKLLSRYMRTTAQKIDMAYHRQVTGGQLAGVLGSNGHVANGVAAIFLACGQDMANISESCSGYIYTETIGNDLYVSLHMPSVVIGTVGGGVSLPTQKECLKMIDCYGRDKVKKFAEIICATVLAGELSLAAAIVAGDFVTAHEKYGRNKPKEE